MSLAEIENELSKLSAAELREVALRSWSAFLAKESQAAGDAAFVADEPEADLLRALDEATARADLSKGTRLMAEEVRNQLRAWTTR